MPRHDAGSPATSNHSEVLTFLAGQNPFWRDVWTRAGILPRTGDMPPLRELPCVRRQDLVADQDAHPPFGTNLTQPLARYRRQVRTSGTTGRPLSWLDTGASWAALVRASAELFRIAGLASGAKVLVAAPSGPSLGPWVLREGAVQAGALVLAGSGTCEEDARRVLELGPDVLAAAPRRLLDLAAAVRSLGGEPRRVGVRLLIAGGAPGASEPAVRGELETAWRAEVRDRYGMTEAGSVAAECPRRPGRLHISEEIDAEVLVPGVREPLAGDAEGELVVTNLARRDAPVVRYRTGDHVRLLRDVACPCGRRGPVLEGGVRRLAGRPPG